MKKAVWLKPDNMEQWDAFVDQHAFGWICHLSSWKKVIEKSFKHIKGHFLALYDEESDRILAGLPIYTVKSRLTGTRLVSAPFASLFDPLISSNKDIEILLPFILDLYKKNSSSYVEIRSTFSGLMGHNPEIGVSKSVKHHYITLDRPPEDLKKTFHRTAVRQLISKALRSQLQLRIGEKVDDLAQFYSLYFRTRKRIGLPPIPYLYFKSLMDVYGFSGDVTFLFADYNSEPVAGLMVFKYNNKVSLELIGNNEKYSKLYPFHFLYWHAILMASADGCEILSFGKTFKNNKTLIQFKNRWGTRVEETPVFFYPVPVAEKYGTKKSSWKYKVIRKSSAIVPDFLFQLIGNFCYRHMG